MADFSENENQQVEEELSTVFSDPTEHKKIDIKRKKLLPKILAGVLALSVLAGGTWAVIKFIPELEEEVITPETPETIEVKKLDTDSISNVVVTNANGTVELCAETVEDDTTESEGDTTVNWYTKQVDKSLTNSYNIEQIVEAVTNITSTLKITEKTAEECGFSDVKTKAVVTANDGDNYTVLLGDKSPDNSGYYLKIENQDIIYLVEESIYTTLQFELLDFAATPTIGGLNKDDSDISSYFSEEGSLMSFDNLVISGDNYPKAINVVMNEENLISEYYSFLITAPQKRLGENLDDIISTFQTGITSTGAYAYDVKTETLKNFGLDKPDAQFEMKLGGRTVTYKIDLQSDGGYAVITDDSPVVYKVDASTLSTIMGYETTDFYLNTVFIINIDNLSNFTIKTADKEYSFDIVKNEDEESEDDYTITIGGKELVADNFQNFYANCISMETKDFVEEDVSGAPDVSFVMTLKKGGTSTVEFKKVSATRYQCRLDKMDMGRVTTSSLNNILRLAEKTANGEKIDFN